MIKLYQKLNKVIYLVSAGLYPAIEEFGTLLGIARQNIFAVNIYFDAKGHFIDFDHDSPLVYSDGKKIIAKDLQHKHKNLVHVGDGLNDLVTKDIVTRFIGFGGVVHRENIAKQYC